MVILGFQYGRDHISVFQSSLHAHIWLGALHGWYSIMLDTVNLISTEKVAQKDIVEGRFVILVAQ